MLNLVIFSTCKENAKDLVYTFTEIVKFWRDHAKENEQKNIVSEYQNLIDESDLLRLANSVHGVPEKYLELVKIKQIGACSCSSFVQKWLQK